MIINKATAVTLKTAAIIAAFTTIATAAVWAGDTRWVTVAAQKQTEIRQLKRDIKRLELKDANGNASAEDRAFLEFLRQDLEDLQHQVE